MKKLISLVLALTCVLGMVGCANTRKVDLIPMVMVDGVLYLDTGFSNTDTRKSETPDGEITSKVDGSEMPTVDNQSNFGTGYVYQYGATEGTIEIYMNDKWRIFATEEVRQKLQFPERDTEQNNEVQPGGTPADEVFDIAVSYANWAGAPIESFGALNTDKLAISSVRHLPIYRFDTLKDLEQFQLFDDRFTFDSGYDEIPSFNDTVAKYDDAFFGENSLMLVYVSANSGSYRYGVNSIFCDGTSFCIHVEQTNNPESVTMDMAGWFITVAVPDSMVENCTEFDADLNNFN